jgi:hypothetical protein
MRAVPTICQGLFCLVALLLLSSCGLRLYFYGLKPEYPKMQYSFGGARIAISEVNSLQPTFRWESFPRPQDIKNDKDGLIAQIHNVTYDLKIWRVEDYNSGKIAYRREGLPEPLHKIEEPLEPSTRYSWTIRARFEVDGHIRVTEWGALCVNNRSPIVQYGSPNRCYSGYQFDTPPT